MCRSSAKLHYILTTHVGLVAVHWLLGLPWEHASQRLGGLDKSQGWAMGGPSLAMGGALVDQGWARSRPGRRGGLLENLGLKNAITSFSTKRIPSFQLFVAGSLGR